MIDIIWRLCLWCKGFNTCTAGRYKIASNGGRTTCWQRTWAECWKMRDILEDL